MEQNLHNRVYINPNFKRADVEPWPSTPIRTTHFNRHYLEEMPSRQTNMSLVNNRKIYVNPNFISGKTNQNRPLTQVYLNTNEDESVNNVPVREILHKSKYSLVQGVQQNVVHKTPATNEIYKNNVQTIISESCQHIGKLSQEVPLTKSKYCIIRKKKRLSVNTEYKSVSSTSSLTKHSVPITSSSQLSCSRNLQSSLKNKLTTSEKITKIKISKYKTVPLSYFKKNSSELNKNKYVMTPIKAYLRSTKLNSLNKYKFIKTNTPVKFSSPATNTPLRIVQNKEKIMRSVGSKPKLPKPAGSRTMFKINNIPCRLFTKYGKCLRQDKGNCKYLHNKKHVSLCLKFLKGICHNKNCTLSHELTDKKMPTCYFYLEGMCTKECCPYLHVKLSDKTKICQEFTKGYCENGDKCLFRHVNISKIKKARKQPVSTSQKKSHNKVRKMNQHRIGKIKTEICDTTKNKINSEETIQNSNDNCRYYKETANIDDSYENIKPSRCKLGSLPSFIKL